MTVSWLLLVKLIKGVNKYRFL